jgi:hypothetical protein
MAEVDYSKLGLFNTKSKKWWVSYNGSASLKLGLGAGGVYEFIFRGDDSLSGAVVSLTAAGVGLGFGISKLGKNRGGGTGKGGKQKKSDGETIAEAAEDAVNINDSVNDHNSLRRNANPWCNMTSPSLLVARRPFSLYELTQAWGGIEFAGEAGAYLKGAAILSLNASMSVFSSYTPSDTNTLFEGWRVYNTDDGSVGAGIYAVQGKWSVERYDNLYINRCPIKSGPGLENFYSNRQELQDLPSP